MKNQALYPLLASLVLLVALTGCDARAQEAAAGPPPPAAVTVERVEQRPIVEHAEITGRLVAAEMVELRPRVSGHIQEVRFQAGQIVEPGEVLFLIDPRWHQAAFEQADAELQSAQSRLSVAEREHERAQKLVERKAVSAEELEARSARLQGATAAVAAAGAARTSAELDLEYTQVRAPIRGRVSRALVTAGNYVSGVAGSNSLLATIVSQDPVHFYADLDEATYLRLDRALRALPEHPDAGGVSIELGLGDESGYPHHGQVESLDNRLDPASGTILLRAVFANPDGLLVPGLYARARIPIGVPEPALLVDERAIGTDQNQKFVLALAAGNVAEYRRIQLGTLIGGKRVVRSGLAAEDSVIVSGLQRVRPGMTVDPKPAAPAAPTVGEQRAPAQR